MHGIDDDEFEVKLGRISNRRARKATSYLRRVRQELRVGEVVVDHDLGGGQ